MSDQNKYNSYIIKKNFIRARLGKYTKKAFLMLPEILNPNILDLGCGTGIPAVELAKISNGCIFGMDINDNILKTLKINIEKFDFSERIIVFCGSILSLPLKKEMFDIIWAEGIIASIDFQKGLMEWRDLLKTDGYIVLHDDNTDIDEKIKKIEDSGYNLLNQFLLSDDIWWHEYYGPLEKLLEETDENTREVKNDQLEIKMFKKNPTQFNSIFFILQKIIDE